jgi:hypothetical protein
MQSNVIELTRDCEATEAASDQDGRPERTT